MGQELTGERKVDGHSFFDLKLFYLIEPLNLKQNFAPTLLSDFDGTSSSDFDGSYWFELKFVKPPAKPRTIGYGSFVINEGMVTINKGFNLEEKIEYDNFDGQIDKDGDIEASFYFNPCSRCNMADKIVWFTGNINKLELSGLYNGFQVIFNILSSSYEDKLSAYTNQQAADKEVEDEIAAFEAELAAELGQ